MILTLIMTLSSFLWADPTWKWTNAIEIVEVHEFYKNNAVIVKPQDSWQTLFAVMYHDTNLQTFKDCVFYRVPGAEPGVLKIKTIDQKEKCEEQLYRAGDLEYSGLKALQYSVTEKMVTVSMTDKKFQVERWDIPLFNVFQHPEPTNLSSSAEYRAPKMIFLKPYKGLLVVKPQKAASSQLKVCHDIGDDCKEKSPSVCMTCPEGWYEIPNGCNEGPKYCGKIVCGLKNAPACRRGYYWQRKDKTYSCRDDASFAYCAKGLRVQCEGNLPYCI